MKTKFVVSIPIVLALGLNPVTAPAGDNLDEMKAIYNKGVELYGQERYDEAAQAFRELVKERPMFQYYYNIGECEYSRQRFDLAKEAFDTFLEQGGYNTDPERRKHAEEVLEKITPVLGYLSIDEDANLEVWVDDEHRGTTPTEPIVAMAGNHIVVLKNNGESVLRAKVTVERGETVEVKREETEKALPPPPPQPLPQETLSETETATASVPDAPQPNKNISPLKMVGIGMIGVGGAVMVAGIVTGSVALSKINQLDENCPDKVNCSENDKQLEDSASLLGTTTDALFIAGGVLAATGVVLTVIGHRQNKNSEEKLSFTPMLRNNEAAGLMISGRF